MHVVGGKANVNVVFNTRHFRNLHTQKESTPKQAKKSSVTTKTFDNQNQPKSNAMYRINKMWNALTPGIRKTPASNLLTQNLPNWTSLSMGIVCCFTPYQQYFSYITVVVI